MKTAKEWAVSNIDRASEIADIRAIQLDALTSARNVVRDYPCESGSRCCCVNVQKAIMEILTNPKEPNA